MGGEGARLTGGRGVEERRVEERLGWLVQRPKPFLVKHQYSETRGGVVRCGMLVTEASKSNRSL